MSASWAQDATFNMGQTVAEMTENGCTLTFAGGSIDDVNTEKGFTTLSTKTENGVKTSASMTLTGKPVRYIKITFADEETTYNLKWGGAWNETINADQRVNGKGTLVLVSNSGPSNFKIINDIERGTQSTPIEKVEVYYWNNGYTATEDQTAEKATKTISNAITWQNNTVDLSKINVVGKYASFETNGKGAMLKNSEPNYLSIKFDSPADLSGISYFRIDGENVDKNKEPHVFNLARFICDNGNGGTVNVDKYNNPANVSFTATDATTLAQKEKLKKVYEIRLYNDNFEGSFSINSIKFIYEYTLTWVNNEIPKGCDAWYTIGSDAAQYRDKSKKIEAGTKVTFYGTDTGDDHKMINGWSNPNPNGDYWGWGPTKEITVSSDFSVKPDFQPCFRVFAKADNGATATVNTSGKQFQKVDNLTFTTTVPEGYTFLGWDDGTGIKGNKNPWDYGTYTAPNWTTDLTLTAKFARIYSEIGRPECNHYGSRTNGDNYFDIQRLNPNDGVTISTADNGEGRKITLPTNGGSVSFVFEEKYNLRDIVGWVISDNEALRARVSCVEFFRDADCKDRVADFWNNAGYKSGVNDSRFDGDANKIKAIRICFKTANEVASYDINWMCFKFEHADRTYPTLTEGTEPEMCFYYDKEESLTIANTPGYWRQYTDGSFETIKGDGLIPTDQYKRTYTFTKTDLPAGDYYFAVRDGGTCNLGYRHETDIVKVHVISTAAPKNLTVTYDWNIGGGNPVVGDVPVDSEKYTYKNKAKILGPGQISREGYFFAYWSTTPDGSGTRYSNNAEIGETEILMSQNRTLYAIWNKEGFEGFFQYENRLIAQWNIDLADGARMHEPSMDAGTWTKSGPVELSDGKKKTTYTLKNAVNFGELVYGGTNSSVVIPVFAGLKFKAGADGVKIVVTKKGNEIMNTQLVLAKDVQLQIPYVRNSYRDDGGNAQSPSKWKDRFIKKGTTWGDKTYDKDTWGVVYWSEFSTDRFNAMQDCIHHINRDIVYIVSQPDIWEAMTNKCYNDPDKDLFNSGGDEDVHGLRNGEKKIWKKLNFCGDQGTPCIITFKTETTIDRIGVNRNLTYSFYTENIAANSEGAYTKPFPGLRIVGSPQGAKVADVGDTYATYGNAIAMTYGGWPYNGNEFKDGEGNRIMDSWGNMTVYYGDQADGVITEGTNSYDATQFTNIDVKKVPVATDGFPVYSTEHSHAYSETVNPSKTTGDFIGANADKSYHDQNYGNFLLHQDDGGNQNQAYVENYNPWTLPCRGAYAKFEPTLPGVLNVHILQEPNKVYYIADEFGRLIKEKIFVKTGTSSTNLTNNNGHISIDKKDNVKYSFDVYPGKTYYLFSNEAGMGITGFYFEPYVYRKYHELKDAPTSREVNGQTVQLDQNAEYELARQDVGLKTAEMTAGPVFKFSDETFDYTNQTAACNAGTSTNLDKETGAQIMKEDGSGNQIPDVQYHAAQEKTVAGSYPNQPNNVNPLIYNNKAVHVTLNRRFTKEKWSTIVLPYSMNSLQLETVFGKGTKVVLLRDVQDKSTSPNHKTTINFVYHENQDIIAGYPYMIYPAQDVSTVETNAYLDADAADAKFNSALQSSYKAPSIVEISGVGPNLVTYPTADNHYGGLSCFKWEASYDNVTENMPVGSYVMSSNNMRRVNEGVQMTAGAFKGYLKYVGAPGQAKYRMIDAISFGDGIEDEATAIENILLDAGIVGGKTNVYSINGQMIRQNTDDLSGLPKGVYIVNGKKYIVR